MAKGIKTGGRKPGTPNKRTSELAAMLAQAVGEDFDPVVELAILAQAPDTPIDLRAKVLADIAPYVRPRLKNSEISGAGGGSIQFEVVSAIGEPLDNNCYGSSSLPPANIETPSATLPAPSEAIPCPDTTPMSKWRPRQGSPALLPTSVTSDYDPLAGDAQ